MDDADKERGPGGTLAESPSRRREARVARIAAERQTANYDIEREIARGGLGVIFAARDRSLGRQVAIKRLLHPTSEGLARFRREVEITARLQHPNIIPLHEAGIWEDGDPFFVMKLVDGRPLSDVIDEHVSLEERLALLPHLIGVADAIAYAHTESVIHRDLKPSNILVGPFGETVVIDWGLAKALGDEPDDPAESLAFRARAAAGRYDTTDGAVLGTPGYMAPEQIEGHTGDPRTDVYAIGAILYHLLAGQRPFFELDRAALLESLVDRDPAPLVDLEPEVPADLAAIVDKAMARDPAKRYADASEMAEELRRFSTGRLVSARDYSALELLKRFVGRHQAVFATSAIAFAALAALAIWSVRNIEQKRALAERNAAAYREAKSVAERRVDRVILDEARVLLDVDPTMAAARLKDLSEILPGAASIAADAEERGVARRALDAHGGVVRAIAVSDDGARYYSGGDDGAVIAWSAATGHRRLLGRHGDRVAAIAASGGRVISAGYDGQLVWWPSLTGGAPRVLDGHRGAVSDLAVAGDRVASVSADEGRVALWSVSGEPDFRDIERSRSAAVTLSSDGRWLAAAGAGRQLHLWDLEADRHHELGGEISGIAFSRDRRAVLAAGFDRTVRRWDLATMRVEVLAVLEDSVLAIAAGEARIAAGDMRGNVVVIEGDGAVRPLGRHGERITALAFGPGDARLLTTSWDKTARVWEVDSGESRVLSGHRDVVGAGAFVNGEELITASWDGSLRQWRIAPNRRRVFRGHRVGVKTVAFSDSAPLLASGGHDDTVRLWPLDGAPIVAEGHGDHVYEVRFAPGGQILASSSDDRTVRLWSPTGAALGVLAGHRADVERLAFSTDATLLASASEDDTARIWNVARQSIEFLAEHGGDVTGLAFSPDGRRLVTSSRDGAVRSWPVDGGAAEIIARHAGGARDVGFAANGTVVSLGDDGALRRWSPTGVVVDVAVGLDGARRLAVAPDGERVAVIGTGTVGWLCALDGVVIELVGHRGPIAEVAFSPDGRFVATAAADNTARVWDVATGESRVLRGHTAPVFGVAFSADSSTLATGSGDRTARTWPVAGPPDPETLYDWLDAVTEARFVEN